MKLARTTAILTLFLSAHFTRVSEAQTVALAPCSPSDVPLKVSEDSQLRVVRHLLSNGNQAQGELRLRNLSSKPILALTMLVTYRDSARESLFSIPYYAGIQNAPQKMDIFHPFLEIRWDHPVESGEDFTLFNSNLLSTRERPATAEASVIDIRYADGTQSVVTLGDEGFSDPLLTSLPEFFKVDLTPDDLPTDLIVEIQIDSVGRVLAADPLQNSSPRPRLLEETKQQILQWKFFPATRGVYAVPAKLFLWLRFHPKGLPLPEPTCPLKLSASFPRVFAEVDFLPTDSNRWEVTFNGHPAPSSFGHPRIMDMHAGLDPPPGR